MKRLTLISMLIFILTNVAFSQDIINETGKDGKFIVRDAEQNEALIIDKGNIKINGELMIDNMGTGEVSDEVVVWDKKSKRLKILPQVFSKHSPLSKPLDTAAQNYSVMDPIIPGDRDDPLDQVIADDLIVDGSTCIGNDCYAGYAFGFNSLAFLENNLRIYFDDTSNIQNYR